MYPGFCILRQEFYSATEGLLKSIGVGRTTQCVASNFWIYLQSFLK